ncbi:MAG: thymidylate synthase [Deltaproteobacteria bacterium CG07_land_8_20_14_0_80_38_7]|nr:MAG: thymidylate synthase [Deltaproteobacteria bacterium CG07_land_8_20_14_0_80_38_7]
MKSYLEIVKTILDKGAPKPDRTGTGTLAITGAMFEHDMNDGFPLVTTKSVPFRLVASELEFFIKGITDKKWLQERDNHIWDEWCTPMKIKYAHDEHTKQMMFKERDLGPLYGWQWRHFGARYDHHETDYIGKGVDQLQRLIHDIKTNPNSRQMLVLAWNPCDVDKVVPPFCHYGFQITVLDGKLNLLWNQRSTDVALGLPFNIASYALLLHLLAKETEYAEGRLVGFLADVHIYLNHVDGLKEQLTRTPYALPKLETPKFQSILDWQYTDSKVIEYKHHPRISFEVAV